MLKAGVEVTLLGGRKGYHGEPLSSAEWPKQFGDKLIKTMNLKRQELDVSCHKLPKELWNHSIVADSERRSRAYITSHKEKNIYPATYSRVRDNKACQEWKRDFPIRDNS